MKNSPHITLAVLVVACMLGLSACGSGIKSATTTAPKVTPASVAKLMPKFVDQPLTPGQVYRPRAFSPALTFKLPDAGWTSDLSPSGHVGIRLLVGPPVEWSTFGIHRMDRVFDPIRGGRTAADAKPAPPDFAAWLEHHPRLQASRPVDITIGGAKGVQIDIVPKSYPRARPDECDQGPSPQCLPLFTVGNEPIVYPKGSKTRMYIVDVKGKQVVFEVFVDPGTQFAKLAPLYDKVLRGIHFA
jgi:hypothetical protein